MLHGVLRLMGEKAPRFLLFEQAEEKNIPLLGKPVSAEAAEAIGGSVRPNAGSTKSSPLDRVSPSFILRSGRLNQPLIEPGCDFSKIQ